MEITRLCDWLTRVNIQFDKETPQKIKEADITRAKNTTVYNFFSRPPAYSGGINVGNTNTTYHTTHQHIYTNASNSSSNTKETESTDKKKETNWKQIAAISALSTVVAAVAVFVYARLSKAKEGAENYLQNTKTIKEYASNNSNDQLTQIAEVQLKIDQNSVNKITNYRKALLTGLAGTVTLAGGALIGVAMPWLATAGAISVIAGGVLGSASLVAAAYNCGTHWSDEEDGKKAFDSVKNKIPDLMKTYSLFQTSSYLGFSPQPSAPPFSSSEAPPTYEQAQAWEQAIYNQRGNPKDIYPDLNELQQGQGKKY